MSVSEAEASVSVPLVGSVSVPLVGSVSVAVGSVVVGLVSDVVGLVSVAVGSVSVVEVESESEALPAVVVSVPESLALAVIVALALAVVVGEVDAVEVAPSDSVLAVSSPLQATPRQAIRETEASFRVLDMASNMPGFPLACTTRTGNSPWPEWGRSP
jgi:hypothetical protein